MAQVELRRGSLVAQVAPREPLEEPTGTQDDPMATQRGAQRAKMTQDGAKGGEKVGLVRSCESLKIHWFYSKIEDMDLPFGSLRVFFGPWGAFLASLGSSEGNFGP